MDYKEFLNTKIKTIQESGFEVEDSQMNPKLFDFQKYCVKRALKAGRFALFQDCGLGKTFQQIEWARLVTEHTNQPVLILCPLAVAGQTIKEGERFGIEIQKLKSDVFGKGIFITNYEQLENIDCSVFSGVVLDESSILKNFTGVYKNLIIDKFQTTKYKLACTATPSPNDLNEIGNHSEFLNILDSQDMRSKWFVRDEGMNNYRLKGHAKKDFYGWISSWAVMICTPADLGFNGDAYCLPSLNYIEKEIATQKRDDFKMFNEVSVNATNFNAELRFTKVERLSEVVSIVNSSTENFIIWVKQNEEGEYLRKLIPDAVEISGSDSLERKEFLSLWFGDVNNECKCQTINLKETKKSISPNIGQSTTKKTSKKSTLKQTNALKSEDNQTQNLENKESSIQKVTTQKTKTNLTNEHPSKTQSETQKEGNNTQKTQHIEIKQKVNHQEIGKQEVSELITTCEGSMGLVTMNTSLCSQIKTMDAQFAEKNQHLSIQNKDFTSTIATNQEKSEDYFAQTAIKDLESSMIAKYCSNVPLCTCCGKHKRKVLISKVKILSFGLNYQNCRNQIFASLDFSFEGLYQAIRRSYRFGQKEEVNIYLITTDTMKNVINTIKVKEAQFLEMQSEMNKNINGEKYGLLNEYEYREYKNDNVFLMKGDTNIEIKRIPDNSVDLIVFSPPFSSLFTYSNYIHDMGNNESHADFFKQYEFLLKELYRILKPGRLMACHTKDLGVYKNSSGYTGMYDFTGEHNESVLNMIPNEWANDTTRKNHKEAEKAGFKFHSKITIWCDPVLEMQRTKTQRLLYKTVTSDSTKTGIGMAEYVTIFKKWDGTNEENWEAVTNLNKQNFPLDTWQKWASPVWMDIKRTDVLNGHEGTEMGDEKHIAPLQLEVIHRIVNLWSNEGEVVFTPFLGIGSEAYVSVKNNRKAIGCELKDSYFDVAVKNVKKAELLKTQVTLF